MVGVALIWGYNVPNAWDEKIGLNLHEATALQVLWARSLGSANRVEIMKRGQGRLKESVLKGGESQRSLHDKRQKKKTARES